MGRRRERGAEAPRERRVQRPLGRLNHRIDPDAHSRLQQYAAWRRITENAAIEEAIALLTRGFAVYCRGAEPAEARGNAPQPGAPNRPGITPVSTDDAGGGSQGVGSAA